MTRLDFTLTNDALFKMLFVKYPELLKYLVAELLGIGIESIGVFEIRNPEMPPERLGDKFCRLDITMTINGQRVGLEVQVQDKGDYPARALYYWAKEYSTALPEGEPYEKLPRTILISIVDFELIDDSPVFQSEYRVLEVKRHTQLTDKLNLLFFELPKLPEPVNPENSLELWLSLFKAKTEEDLARIKALEVPVMNQTIEAYRSVAVSPEFQEIERVRSRARHDEAQALGQARREGHREGLQEGRQEGHREGLQEGRQEGKCDVARTALRMAMPIDSIVRLTGLSREEIEKLRDAH